MTLKFTVVKFTDVSESGHKFLVIRYRLKGHSVADKNEHKFVYVNITSAAVCKGRQQISSAI